MSDLAFVKNFRDLVIYGKARELQREIFKMTSSFPKDERYSLSDQIRRSSRSIGANIAEAWAKRRYVKHFLSKLTDADDEQHETQHWIETAEECGYVDRQEAKLLIDKCAEIGRMLGGMMEKADLFCGESYNVTHESPSEYLVDQLDNTD